MSEGSVMRPHHGAAILAAARTYPKVMLVILEAIQNAIDARARNVWIQIDWVKRSITIRDDGDGATLETFEKALSNVGNSIKGAGSLGKWGYGLVAPLGKCAHFTFTSQAKGSRVGPYNRWTFVTDDIRDAASEIVIPRDELNLTFSRSTKGHPGQVNWRTSVELKGVVENKRVADFNVNELLDTAIDEFRVKMLERDVTLHLSVTPTNGHPYQQSVKAEAYSGEKLEPRQYNVGGKVVRVNLWLTKLSSGKYAGKVGVGMIADAFRVPMKAFVDSHRGLLGKELAKALCSGVFEGEITSNLITLQADRKSFEDNDDLVDFCCELEKWFEKVGREYYDEACDKVESERFMRNAEQTLDALQRMLDDPANKELADLVKSFPPNPHGVGVRLPDHVPGGIEVDVPGRETTHKVTRTVKRGRGKRPGPRPGPGPGPGPGPNPGPNDGRTVTVEVDEPIVVPDPTGKARMTVRVKNFGLRFGETEDIFSAWELDMSQGILWFNIGHAYYSQCRDHKSSDKVIREYQRFVAIQALSLYAIPEDWRETAKEAQDLELRSYVSMITQ